MKKTIILSVFCIIGTSVQAQDIIKTKSGEEYKATLLKLNRKEATFKKSDDPEFSTYTLPYKDIATIQEAGEKKPVYFNHKLPRAYICGSLGGSIALGSFAKEDYESTTKEPGFARNGSLGSLEVGFYIYKKIGLNLVFSRIYNPFQANRYADLFNTSSSSSDSYSVEFANGNDINKENWVQNTGLIGLMYSVKVNKRLTCDLIGRVGPVGVVKPYIQLVRSVANSTGGGNYTEFYQYTYKQRTSMGLNGALNLRYMLSKRLALFVSANYLYTSTYLNMEYTYPEFNKDANIVEQVIVGLKVPYTLSTLNANLGLAFNFKRKGNKYE